MRVDYSGGDANDTDGGPPGISRDGLLLRQRPRRYVHDIVVQVMSDCESPSVSLRHTSSFAV